MAEQVITLDLLIDYLCKKEPEPLSDEQVTITHYNNDNDISNKLTLREKNEKILKGMLKDELVEILLNFYGVNITKTALKKKKVAELIEEILNNNIEL